MDTSSLAFYATYHRNKINRIIHYITIPCIVFCIFSFLNYIPVGVMHSPGFPLNIVNFNILNVILTFLYIMYCTLVWHVYGILLAIPLYTLMALSNLCVYNIKSFYIVAIIIFILSWIFQILGHYIFEKRSPAFLQSFHQAFIIAPFFVFLEILFACGFFTDLESKINAEIVLDEYSKEFGSA